MTAPEPGDRNAPPTELHGLLDSFVGLTSLRDPVEILQRAVDIARLSTQARYGAAVRLKNGQISAFVYEGLTQREVDALPHLPEGLGMLGAVLEQATPIRMDRLQDDPRSVGFPLNHVPMSAFLGVPIKTGEKLRGALYLTKPPGHGSFTKQDEFFMMTLADQTSVALETANLINELEEQRAITQLLERVAVASNEAQELSQALQTAVDAICGHTGWPIGHVFLPSAGDPDVLESTNIWHLRDPHAFQEFVDATEQTRLRRGEGLPGGVWAAGKAIWIEDVTLDGNFPRAAPARSVGVKSGYGLPIMVESEVVGVLEFFIPESKLLDKDLLEVGTFIGTQLGRVIERERVEAGLQALDQAKSAFVANAAHELRTPLTTILGLTEIIGNPNRPLEPDQFTESMAMLKRQGERVNALLTNLLDYSRIEVTPIRGGLATIDLNAAVREAIAAAPAPDNVSIAVDIPQGESALADPVRLEQVFVNLLTNAYRYGGPHISITGAVRADEIVVTFSDDGPGIEPHLLPQLFDPFTRGSDTQSITGSGLGLAIVKRLIESFDGRISVENQAPTGASFEIRLKRSS